MNKDKEPLLDASQWAYLKNIKQWKKEVVEAYAKYHTQWHLNNLITHLQKSETYLTKHFRDKEIQSGIENYIKENL